MNWYIINLLSISYLVIKIIELIPIGINEDGGGSPRNMDFILEQAKENHRNGIINDSEYSTIIRQVFQMSESKMIREVQRRDSGPTFPRDRDFRYPSGSGPGPGPGPGPVPGPGPYPEPMPGPMQERHAWNDSMGRDPRLGGYPPFENRLPRYEHPAPRGPLMPAGPPRPMATGLNTAFEVLIVLFVFFRSILLHFAIMIHKFMFKSEI